MNFQGSQKTKTINLHRGYRVNASLIKRIASHVLACCKKNKIKEFELVFLTNRGIRPLNKRYKGEDRATDVLSFDLDGIGAIFISIDKALTNSKIFKTALEEELTLYVIHGILHLAGYDDESRADRVKMEAKQSKILEEICKREDLSKVLTPR